MTSSISIFDSDFDDFTIIDDTSSPTVVASTITSSIIRGLGSTTLFLIQSSLLRKTLFVTAMYTAGGAIVATVGLPVTIVAGSIILAI